MLERVIRWSFYLLFLLTPLFWSSLNYELFEYNKMILVYAFTVIITGAWFLKSLKEKKFTFRRTPLDIPLLIFLAAGILSTIFSIDRHISIWGYYSRSNGGLLSLVSYLLLYWAFVSNMALPQVKNALKFALASGLIISLWGIMEHFGVSPSCIILRGELNADCWIQRVQERVFATLGQPNWLAAYLAMLIFPAFYFFLSSEDQREKIKYFFALIAMYLAFTFSYSRGPTLGLIGGLGVFIGLLVLKAKSFNFKLVFVVLSSFVLVNLLFGSALTNFRLVSKFAAPVRPAITIPAPPAGGGTQLENGGTESGQIRLIVWKGALEIFKHYPVFGSGLETFAYSYYQFRPAEHNLTSEWDFLYNKAHNEYLNYLATTGTVGLTAYFLVIGSFIYRSTKLFFAKLTNDQRILTAGLLGAYISYLIYNFFLFSVVIIAVFFFLFPAMVFITSGTLKSSGRFADIANYVFRRGFYVTAAKALVIFFGLFLLYSILQIWYADTLFSKGQKASDSGNPGRAYNYLTLASQINKSEPFYRSELGFSAAQASIALEESDATLSAKLKDQAVAETENVLNNHPKNVSFLRTAIRTYFELSSLDEKYLDKTIQSLDSAITLAPTDPKLYYHKALVLQALDKNEESVKFFEQAVKLKPNYAEALAGLKEATASANK